MLKTIGQLTLERDFLRSCFRQCGLLGITRSTVYYEPKQLDEAAVLVSKITDKILPEVNEWQNRPLEGIYPVVFFDGIVFHSRKDNRRR